MINQTEQTLFRLENLNTEQRRISYQLSSGKILEKGSDDSVLYAREIHIDDKIRVMKGIDTQLTKTDVHNNVADTALDNIKKLMEDVKSELLKANTDTTTDVGKQAIAVSLEGIKQNMLDLANSRIDGEYLFAGSDSSVKPFEENATTGVVSYNGDNLLRKIAVDEGSYREKGVNGFDILMYPADIATQNDPNLSFLETDRIIDQDGMEWKLNGAKTQIEQYDFDGNLTGNTLLAPNDLGTPPIYTSNVGVANGTKFEAKTNIFDVIDDVVNALNKVDSVGAPITDAAAKAELNANIAKVNASFDAINVAHAELGGRNKVFELSQEKISAKLTQFEILSIEVGAADFAKLGVEAKALELTFTALYSTINKVSELSLVNFIR